MKALGYVLYRIALACLRGVEWARAHTREGLGHGRLVIEWKEDE